MLRAVADTHALVWYLFADPRLGPTARQVFDAAAPLDRHVARALRTIARDQIPDLPDRIIAATALVLQVPLITRDGKIRLSEVPTLW